jgi:hypothetical protein
VTGKAGKGKMKRKKGDANENDGEVAPPESAHEMSVISQRHANRFSGDVLVEERDLLDEQTYRRSRAEESVWRRAKAARVSRKRMLQLLASAAGAAIGAKTNGAGAQAATGGPGFDIEGETGDFGQYSNWFKKLTPNEYFIDHGHAREMRWDKARDLDFTVPNDLFYLQNHFPTPQVDIGDYRLTVTGEASPDR